MTSEHDGTLSPEEELNLSQLRAFLNKEKVKLWLEPYYVNENIVMEVINRLAERCSVELGLDHKASIDGLINLQRRALHTLEQRKRNETLGTVSLSVKFKSQQFTVEVDLSARGMELYSAVAANIKVHPACIKLIAMGSVIQNDKYISEQKIKPGTRLLCLATEAKPLKELSQQEQANRTVNRTVDAAGTLADRTEDDYLNDHMTLQVTNQNGIPLVLPGPEKKALATAMALHDRGRLSIRHGQFDQALTLLLESHRHFSQCSSDILKLVDNFAVLNLDIVWCYLHMRLLTELPDAESRLNQTEEVLRRSYGNNLERVTTIKGNVGAERLLFLRLRLLQGIVAFYQGRLVDAQKLLAETQQLLQRLEVHPTHMQQLMELGLTEREARFGLRTFPGDVTAAYHFILKKREDRREMRKKEKEEKERNKKGLSLGRCANGKVVDYQAYCTLCQMGYPRIVSSAALKHCNNDITAAIQVASNERHLLNIADETYSERLEENTVILVSLGYRTEAAREALKRSKNDVKVAKELLESCGGELESQSDSSLKKAESSQAKQTDNADQSMMNELIEAIPEDGDDYLDSTLGEEISFLNEFSTKLQNRRALIRKAE